MNCSRTEGRYPESLTGRPCTGVYTGVYTGVCTASTEGQKRRLKCDQARRYLVDMEVGIDAFDTRNRQHLDELHQEIKQLKGILILDFVCLIRLNVSIKINRGLVWKCAYTLMQVLSLEGETIT